MKFIIGERVVVYGSSVFGDYLNHNSYRQIEEKFFGTVTDNGSEKSGFVRIRPCRKTESFTFHEKQCRKIRRVKKAARRRVWLLKDYADKNFPLQTPLYTPEDVWRLVSQRPTLPELFVEFVEVTKRKAIK